MSTAIPANRYKNHRFPVEIISHAVWLYFRFCLSLRDVEELLLERGVVVTYEAIRKWCRKFGQQYANQLRRRRPRPGDKWHLEMCQTQPELLAHHYTEAGLTAYAIPYWQQAGQRAASHSANREASNHLTKGLELLKTLPPTPERIQQELTLQIALGVPLIATRGYTTLEVERTYTRALELCRQVGETPQLFPVLRGLWLFYCTRAELQTARELGEQLLALTQSGQNPGLLPLAHYALGLTLFYLGELVPARAHMEQGIALYDPQQHRSLSVLYGQDPGVVCLSYAASILWLLGYPDQALQRSHEALTLARELSHPFSETLALHFAALLHHSRREGRTAQERAETVIALSIEHGFVFRVAWGTIVRGWALAEQGQIAEGIAQMHQGLSDWQATGTELARPHCLALLAEAYGKQGQRGAGLNVLVEALAAVNKTGERFYEAELYRLKGELMLQQSSVQKGAEECFQQAIAIARTQQAKSLELRAATSLARLWQQHGKQQEAHKLLAEIYGWFTEGFDTKDLQEAKALLEELT